MNGSEVARGAWIRFEFVAQLAYVGINHPGIWILIVAPNGVQRVLKRQPEFASAHFNLGSAYLQSGLNQEAISAFETAIRISGVQQAELGLGCAYARAGDVKKTARDLGQLGGVRSTHYLLSPYLASTMVFAPIRVRGFC